MKKLISVILLFALLLSCCACGNTGNQNDSTTEPSTEATEPSTEPITVDPPKKNDKEDFSNVNELEPNSKGVYQIHSIKGLQNIANHLDGEFELLCDIDLEGAVWTPIGTKDAPFTGTLKGKNFTISNFKIEAPTADGDMGFIGVNKGSVQQLTMENLTITTTESTVRVGSVAGTNEGTVMRCYTYGVINAEKMADNAACGGSVGANTGSIRFAVADMDILYTAAGKADIGGVVGSITDGVFRDNNADGSLDVANGKNKNVGLLAGYDKGVELERGVFMGESNRIDGKLFTNYIGKSNGGSASDCRWRDNSAEPLSAEVRALREKVVQKMYDMGTVMYTTNVTLGPECVPSCNAQVCRKGMTAGTLYRGLPYKHNYSSLDQLMYCLDEDNVLLDWVVEQGAIGGYQNYMGSSCYVSCGLAWATVSNSVNSLNSMATVFYQEDVGTIPVGNWGEKWPVEKRLNDGYTTKVRNYISEQEYYECLAQIRAGDVTTRVLTGGAHSQMAASDAVVVRKDNGEIDPTLSYVYIHDQGSGESTCNEFVTTWGINIKWTFARLYGDNMLPVTCEELLTGEMETPEASMIGGVEGFMGLMTGTVKSNYFVDSVSLKITDSQGNTVFDEKMFARVEDIVDYGIIPMKGGMLVDEFDMAKFTPRIMELELYNDEQYHAVVTANLFTEDHIVVAELDF